MNTLNLLDANVWLALLWSRHAHAETARNWFEKASQEEFFFCRFLQTAFSIQPSAFSPHTLSPARRAFLGMDTAEVAEC